jgi:aminodeoxychorismate lyase
MMHNYFNFNGKIFAGGKAVISPDNRSFRYGDGLFETLRISRGNISLADLHFERLFAGIRHLQFELPGYFTPDYLKQQVLMLCEKNGNLSSARIRLVVFRGNGGLYDADNHFPNIVIQGFALPDRGEQINENGLDIGLYTDGAKACDDLSNLKSNNYLLYVLAALQAKKERLNDCLVLNTNGRIADSTIANLFMVKDDIIYTPPLTEACIAGVMRRYLLASLPAAGFTIEEKPLDIIDIKNADELFLSNVIHGIRWVKSFGSYSYSNQLSATMYHKLIKDLR